MAKPTIFLGESLFESYDLNIFLSFLAPPPSPGGRNGL
jgi:hypothetical protein